MYKGQSIRSLLCAEFVELTLFSIEYTPHQSLKLLLSGKLQNRTKRPKGVPKLKCPAKLQRAQHLTHESHLRHSSYKSYHEIDSLHTFYSDI